MAVAMPKIHTLKRRADFLDAASSGVKCATKGLILQIRPHKAAPAISAYGLTASRRVGNAVARNRAKRRLRALVREVLPVQAKPGQDYVLIARPDTLTRDFTLLRGDLIYALRKLGALR